LSPQESTPGGRKKSGIALAGTIGGYVALCILVGLALGIVLDRVLHTAPLFLIAGVVLGFIASFFLVYKLAMGALEE
jgi:F0F1-type ATP synthase assembly protein I